MRQKDRGKEKFVPVELPSKRKRGRPRRSDVGPYSAQLENPNPPPAESTPSNQPQESTEIPSNDGGPASTGGFGLSLGQIVHGVIDADIDDGYLFSVEVNGVIMRGVVLKRDKVAPITAANDVAPGAKMILRQDIPSPGNLQSQMQSESAVASNPDYAAAQKVTETGNQARTPAQIASSHNEETPAFAQKTDEDEEMLSGDEEEEVDSGIKSTEIEPVDSEFKEPSDAEIEQATEPSRPSPPKSPAQETADEAGKDVQGKATSPEPEHQSEPKPEPSAGEVTLSLGLNNRPFTSSEVQSRMPGPNSILGPVMTLGPALDLASGSTGDDVAQPMEDDSEAAEDAGPADADADAGNAELAGGSNGP